MLISYHNLYFKKHGTGKIVIMKKMRLDIYLVEKKLAESRSQAQKLVMEGMVRVNGQVAMKPSEKVIETDDITVEHGPRYVSRGGEKLEAALQAFEMRDLSGKICADVGASTGGFTDCLLQHGAERVYAIDVGYGILHWKLRNDRRVIVLERTNARKIEHLDELVEVVTIDASFISLKLLLPVVQHWLRQPGQVIALVKPQFEAGKKQAARGKGVIRDPEVHRQVLLEVIEASNRSGYSAAGLIASPLRGPKGNTEFLLLLDYPSLSQLDPEDLIEQVLPEDEI
jgi:23S rRNA (cytidine1920-2'-O)/16S rRNA (cytidine1409-2'-O)-methyltransferase